MKIDNQNLYKVHTGGANWKYFQTLDSARQFCEFMFKKTGNILTIVSVSIRGGIR